MQYLFSYLIYFVRNISGCQVRSYLEREGNFNALSTCEQSLVRLQFEDDLENRAHYSDLDLQMILILVWHVTPVHTSTGGGISLTLK
jgi:hypothetical protein